MPRGYHPIVHFKEKQVQQRSPPLYLASNRMYALVFLEVFVALLIILFELFDDIRADIRVLFLDLLRNRQGILKGDHAFATLSEQVLDK